MIESAFLLFNVNGGYNDPNLAIDAKNANGYAAWGPAENVGPGWVYSPNLRTLVQDVVNRSDL